MQLRKNYKNWLPMLAVALILGVMSQVGAQAAFDTNITAMIDELSTFFTTKIIPWVVLVMGVVLIAGLIMRFRKGTPR